MSVYPLAAITGSASQADEVAVGAASAQFPNINGMASGQCFIYCATVDSWIKQGANPTASAAAGSMFVPAKTFVFLSGANGAKLAVIEDSSGGKASLTAVQL